MRIVFFILCFLSSAIATHPIPPHEADEELELTEHSCLESVLVEFMAKGGTVVRLEHDAAPFPLSLGDCVFPACSGGNNRSQTLWNVLRPYADRIVLMPPHATRYGFDPYNNRANWHRTFHMYEGDEFILWAGVRKSQKFGWDLFGHMLSESEASFEALARMREYYSRLYYGSSSTPDIRRVYITFAKNAHIHLYRLNEVNQSLKNVVVLVFPVEDLIYSPLPEWNTYPYSVQAYISLANLLKSYLDLSQLH